MLQRMECAKDFRNAAWEHLGKGGWMPSILGYLFNGLTLGVVFAIVFFAIISVAGALGVNELVNVDQEVLRAKGLAAALTFNRVENSEVMTNLFLWISLSSLLLLAGMYMISVLTYGMAAMGMAVIRGGASFGHAVSGYGKGWRTTWLMALSGMYQFFWFLLLVVPGIRAFYSYRLIYFLKVDRPELPADKIIAESKRLMDGRRWKLFCLDISYIWWFLASALLTHNLLDIMVRPYHATACAAFYEDLLNRDEAGAFGAEYGADD